MKLIYLVRHCSTKWSESGRLQGAQDKPLSERGLTQAKQLALQLSTIPVDNIVSSDLSRALHTAQIIKKHHNNCGLIQDPSLREISFGDLEGRSKEECKRLYPGLWNNWLFNPMAVDFPNGDSVKEFVAKSWLNFQRIVKSVSGTTFIISHGFWIRSILARVCFPDTLDKMNSIINLQCGEFAIIECEAAGFRIIANG